MKVQLRFFAFIVASLFAVGCGAKTQDVSGNVTFDGEAVVEGYIAFIPEEKGSGAASPIKDGRYKASVPPGKSKVQITATKTVPLPQGEKGMYGETDMQKQYIPVKYNSETELTVDVPLTTPTLDFTLKSK